MQNEISQISKFAKIRDDAEIFATKVLENSLKLLVDATKTPPVAQDNKQS